MGIILGFDMAKIAKCISEVPMKFHELIGKIRSKSWKGLILLLLQAAIIILVVRELYNDISHVRFSKVDMIWLIVYIAKVLIFGAILYIIYSKVKHLLKKGPGYKRACYLFLIIIVFVMPFINGSIFGVLFVDGVYWGKVIDADTGKPIAGASVVGSWGFSSYAVTLYIKSYADARETVTDEQGRFFLPVARSIMLWPLSRIYSRGVRVYKPGYDSYPSRMHKAWNDKDKEKWLHKLNRQYPEFKKEYSKKYHTQQHKSGFSFYKIDPKEYFSNPKYAPSIYKRIFGVG